MEPNVGLDLSTLRLQPEPKPRVRCLSDCTTQTTPETTLSEHITHLELADNLLVHLLLASLP